MGLPTRLSEVNIKGDRIGEMVKQCLDGGRGVAGGFKKLYAEDLAKIYEMAL